MLRSFLFVSSILFIAGIRADAQWAEIGSPGDAAIYALAAEGDTLYAGTQYDLIRSTDGGQTWELKDSGLPTSFVPAGSLAISGGVLFAGSSSAGVYRSSDHAATWQAANNGLPTFGLYDAVVLAHAGVVYLGVAGFGSAGFYRSTDGGDLWEPFAGGPDTTVTAIHAWGDTLIAATIDGRIFRSTDLGASWGSGDPLSVASPHVRNFTDARGDLFAATGGYGVFRSTDRGTSWSAVNAGFTDPAVWVRSIAAVDTVLFAGIDYSGNGGVWRSTDRGGSWENVSGARMTVSTSPPVGTVDVFFKQYSMLASGGTIYAGTFGYGLLRSTDLGASWRQLTVPFRHQYLPALALFGDTLLAGGPSDETAYVSADRGAHWEGYRYNLLSGVTTYARDGQYLYAGLASTVLARGVSRSSDGGATWEQASTGLPLAQTHALVADGGTLYAATNNGLFASTDQGGNWTATTWTDDAAGLYARDSLLVVGTLSPQMTFLSTDAGTTWDTVGGGLPLNFAARSFAAIGETLFVCGTGSSSTLFRSADGGASWTNVTGPTLAVQVTADGSVLWANGVSPWFSVNGGSSWTQVPLGGNVPNGFASIVAGGGFVYGSVGGGGVHGIFRRSLSGLVAVEEPGRGLPMAAGLEQNYPNPFNPSTTIRFAAAERGRARIEAFDVLGRRVALLHDGTVEPGVHELVWEAAGLAGGFYYIRLEVGNVREVRKAVLLK